MKRFFYCKVNAGKGGTIIGTKETNESLTAVCKGRDIGVVVHAHYNTKKKREELAVILCRGYGDESKARRVKHLGVYFTSKRKGILKIKERGTK